MNRFHVNITVSDLEQSIAFYNTLFGQAPSVQETDYAKWMLDDPRVNFAISQSCGKPGVGHLGLQADTLEELEPVQQRLREAGKVSLEQSDAHCCYARSTKTWAQDPDGVSWETFVTQGQVTTYGDDVAPGERLHGAVPEPAGQASVEAGCCG